MSGALFEPSERSDPSIRRRSPYLLDPTKMANGP
eukprot:CAMPEP_0179487632 /NCGR_PEP_ID=MMETSP0799-20121207/63553_1 /TAXON_ID=46947 /ORGANISM="Geminigera cryophila, Strain CCMP2564" /LENGTH=33 /DNA_ID= /DNA_START= /DNA_END= /DNA_ORIENTATION=